MTLGANNACRRAGGFTLIEVMVALLLVAIALPALMFQLGSQADSVQALRDRTIAAWVARDQLSLMELRRAAGELTGSSRTEGVVTMAQRQWPWLSVLENTEVPGMLKQTIYVGKPVTDSGIRSLAALTASPRQQAVLSLNSWVAER